MERSPERQRALEEARQACIRLAVLGELMEVEPVIDSLLMSKLKARAQLRQASQEPRPIPYLPLWLLTWTERGYEALKTLDALDQAEAEASHVVEKEDT